MFGGSNNSPSGFGSASGNFGAQPVTSNSGAYYTVVFTAFQFRISIISVIVHTVIDEALSTFTVIVFLSLKIPENFLEMSIVVILQACLDRCPARRHPDHLVLQPLRLKIHRVLPAIVRQQYQSPVALASAQQCQQQAAPVQAPASGADGGGGESGHGAFLVDGAAGRCTASAGFRQGGRGSDKRRADSAASQAGEQLLDEGVAAGAVEVVHLGTVE